MNYMLFDHEGCHSGRCVWQTHGMKCLILREISDPKNHTEEKRLCDELLNHAVWLIENYKRMGFTKANSFETESSSAKQSADTQTA